MKIKVYKVYWLDNNISIITGKTLISALLKFGFGKEAKKMIRQYEIL